MCSILPSNSRVVMRATTLPGCGRPRAVTRPLEPHCLTSSSSHTRPLARLPIVRRVNAPYRGAGALVTLCVVLALAPSVLVSPTAASTPPAIRSRLPMVAPSQPGFTLQPPAITSVHFSNFVAQSRHLTNQIYLNGSGVAAGDIDGDGRCDLYFCGLDGPNALYRNLGGWRFEETAAAAGVACPELDATGAAFADLDGDGDLDLLVNTVGQGTHVYENDGRGKFRELLPSGGLNFGRGGMSMALADIEGDGDLDVYIANYRKVTIRDQPNTRFKFRTVNGERQLASINDRPVEDPEFAGRFVFRFGMRADGTGTFSYDENGEPDLLLRNEGKGRFSAVPFDSGVFLDSTGRPLTAAPLDWGLSAMFRDLNGDGAPDLYVCNDFRSPDRIWFNDGHGRFRAPDPLAFRQIPLSSMGIDVADINRDGFDDLFVVDMLSAVHERRFSQRMEMKPEALPLGAIENRPQYPRNMLFVNRGDGRWAELGQLSGVEATEWSWTPIFLDVDLDGFEDLLVANGFERDGMNADVVTEIEQLKRTAGPSTIDQLNLRRRYPRLATPNVALRNLGNLRFADVSRLWGFDLPAISQGMAVADLDNDGDLDVVINNFNGPAALYRNNASAPRVAVRLRGRFPNSHGIGARITVRGGAVPSQSQEIICGGRYLSSDDATRTFAAGSLTNQLTLEVTWRSGARSIVAGIQPNESIEVREPESGERLGTNSNADPRPPAITPHFVEHPSFSHSHHEEPFDDFAVQPALSHRLSQLGPGVSWFDFDRDGWDDLIVGAGRGGTLGVFHNDRRGGFQPVHTAPWSNSVSRDLTTPIGWHRSGGGTVVIAGSANYEDGAPTGGIARIFDGSKMELKELATDNEANPASTGPLAMADYSGDGLLDLFVGGRVISGRFPEAARSLCFRSDGENLRLDEAASASLTSVGLVSGAVFTDLDGDGRPELALACQWSSLKIFRWEGRWVDQTSRWGLERFVGLWNGVTAGDFDGDGRLDLAASNWGRNTRYERFRSAPVHLIYGTAANDQPPHLLEAYLDPRQNLRPLQPLHVLLAARASLRERINSYTRFAQSTIPEICGSDWPQTSQLRIHWLESTVFLNRGDHFEPIPLPDEAQWAPAFAVNVADLDGDGQEDLFLSQNFFAVAPELSRHDAGRSLWLRGEGTGRFVAVRASESGWRVDGEQRGAALGDYDRDGRTDLVVTQNGASTRLYRNAGARPGWRVRLRGPAGNPDAIGACLRIVRDGKAGPLRELHAGSGYWSQDSAVAVLGPAGSLARLWVRWPGGKTNSIELPAEAREVAVDSQ